MQRRGLLDGMMHYAGRWPYSCRACGARFHLGVRQAPRASAPHAQQPTHPERHAAMAYRKNAEKPQAKIVVQADTQEQLDHILLALDRAVSSYQRQAQSSAAQQEQPREAAWTR